MKSEPIEQLRDWCKNSNRRAPFDDIIGAIEAYDTLQSQLTQAQTELAELWSKIEMIINDRTKSLTKEHDEAVAACAVMREALEVLSKLGNEPLRGNSKGNEIAARALDSTSTGAAFLERMKEAEWLLGQPLLCKLNSAPALDEWRRRYDAFLKGGVK